MLGVLAYWLESGSGSAAFLSRLGAIGQPKIGNADATIWERLGRTRMPKARDRLPQLFYTVVSQSLTPVSPDAKNIDILTLQTQVELVDRWFPSSKTCSKCGHFPPMPLPKRVFNCGAGKNVISPDLNAAINIEHTPPDRVRRATPEFTPVDKKMQSSLVEAGSKRQRQRKACFE